MNYLAPSLLNMATLSDGPHHHDELYKPHIIIANDHNVIIKIGRNWQRSVGYYKKGNNNEVKKGLIDASGEGREKTAEQAIWTCTGTHNEAQTEHKPSTWTWDNDKQEYLLEERQHFKAEMKMLQAELKNAKECCRAESRKFETDKKLYGELLTERDEFTDELGCSFSLVGW